MRDIVGLEPACAAADSMMRRSRCCSRSRSCGAATRSSAFRRDRAAAGGLRRLLALLDERVRGRVIVDLGLVRNIGYYTGAVFEIYDPAVGVPIGGGGRYDDLLGRFGRSLPAVGFALGVDRLHVALAGEERGTGLDSRRQPPAMSARLG